MDILGADCSWLTVKCGFVRLFCSVDGLGVGLVVLPQVLFCFWGLFVGFFCFCWIVGVLFIDLGCWHFRGLLYALWFEGLFPEG